MRVFIVSVREIVTFHAILRLLPHVPHDRYENLSGGNECVFTARYMLCQYIHIVIAVLGLGRSPMEFSVADA